MLLCDAAQAVAGKLYILGGGWTHIIQGTPTPMGLAVRILVPWDQANQPFAVRIQLMTADGAPVDVGQGLVEAVARLEVGRPPGLRRGAPLVSVLALNIGAMELPVGGYVWELKIDDVEHAREPFEVLGPG
jgi:hypothetical protein